MDITEKLNELVKLVPDGATINYNNDKLIIEYNDNAGCKVKFELYGDIESRLDNMISKLDEKKLDKAINS